MRTKYTPGPYLRNGTTVYALEHDGWRKGEETFQNRFYATVYAGCTCPVEEAEAVAKLFAAAPEMLEVCKRAKELLQSEVTKEPDRTIFWELVAAIAKAGGV